MIGFLTRLGKLLLKPFTEHFLFLLVFFVLATSPCILHQFFVVKSGLNILFVAIHCFVLSYIVTLLIGLIQFGVIRKIVQSVLIVIFAIDFGLNIYCIFNLGYLFDAEFAKIIMDTNVNEAKEFATAMLPMPIILSVLGVYLVLMCLWYLFEKYNLNLRGRLAKMALFLTCLCIFENIHVWGVWQDGPINRLMELPTYETPSNFKEYYTHPVLVFQQDSIIPSNVVLILGESFARCHSSLYGYERNTNPRLSALRDESLLYTFDSIDAPAPSTAQAIKLLMSTYDRQDDNTGKKWYEYTTLIEILQESGFDCYWFSNQAIGSKHNGVARALAGLCDQRWFLQKEGSEKIDEKNQKFLDVVLVDSSYQFVNHLNPQQHNFIVFHMMGSHFHYKMRYPKEFDFFHENDYMSEPQSHREILACYDNSILYNDYIVEHIINLFRDKDALVIYFPDHGQVMYRDKRNPEYYAHGIKNDVISCAFSEEIPFVVYASPLFQKKNPRTMARIRFRQAHTKKWNTDDLPYFIMDLIGIKEIDGENVRSKSVI